MRNYRFMGLVTALVVLVLDQLSKQMVLSWFYQGGQAVRVAPFFNIILAWNPGVSFGFLRAGSPGASWALALLAAVIGLVVFWWLWNSTEKLHSLCFGAILGGAIGNVIDRSLYGAVFDFLDFHAFGYHWYTFNIADCGVVIGAALLFFDAIFIDQKR